jgi:PqqD family protein of HPr-rel-A system
MQILSKLAINNEGFVFNPMSGDSFQVSETGLFILSELRAGHSEEAIVRTLTDKYEVASEIAQRDVADFLANLKHLGLT